VALMASILLDESGARLFDESGVRLFDGVGLWTEQQDTSETWTKQNDT